MNNRKQNKQPLFAEVNLTGDEFEKLQSLFETAMTDFTEQLH